MLPEQQLVLFDVALDQLRNQLNKYNSDQRYSNRLILVDLTQHDNCPLPWD